MNNIENNSNDKFPDIFVGAFIGFLLSILAFIIIDKLPKDIEHYVMIFSYILIACSAIVALFQLQQNAKKNQKEEQWNQKYLAYTKINEYIKYLEKQRTKLDEITVEKELIKNSAGIPISFSDRRTIKRPLNHEEIHDWVCKHDDKKCKIISPSADGKDMYVTTIDGANVVRLLISIINTYEMIASGIKQGMLNKELVLDALDSSIVNNFEFFEDYIKHRRRKHDSIEFACDWENLYKEIKKQKKR